MRGSIYVIAEILIFMLAAAVIGYLIGRLTSRGGRPEPLKRLPGVDGSQAKGDANVADQTADLKRRLGIAYQTIRELEESNMRLRDDAAADEAEDDEGSSEIAAAVESDGDTEEPSEEVESPEAGAEDVVEPDADAAEQEPDLEAATDTDSVAEADDADAAETNGEHVAMGPAERIKAAKAAKDAATAADSSGDITVDDAAAQIAAKDAEISRLKADLDRQMQQMGDLANRISELET